MDGVVVVVTEVVPIDFVGILLPLSVTIYEMMTSLSTSHVLSHLIFQPLENYNHYPHFTDKETDRVLSFKVKYLISNRAAS